MEERKWNRICIEKSHEQVHDAILEMKVEGPGMVNKEERKQSIQ